MQLVGPSRQEGRKVAFAKAQNHGSVFFLLGSRQKVSFTRVCRVRRGVGHGVSIRVELGSLPMGNAD